jgi:hypothetical protein
MAFLLILIPIALAIVAPRYGVDSREGFAVMLPG